MQFTRMVYDTPDLPGPALVEMFVAVDADDDVATLRRRALFISEMTVQATLQRYAVCVELEDEEDC